jgi:ABC-type transport system involved in multi-copper enzyme maturation permease subunit
MNAPGSSSPVVVGRRGRFDPRLVLVICTYALKACFPTKRRIGLMLPAAGALLFALLARLIPDPAAESLAAVADGGLFGVVLPVGCLVIGDAVLGAEVRSGTLHFTWLSPAAFATIVAGRWLAGFATALVALAVPFGLAALVAGVPEAIGPLALSAAAGSAAYVAVFVLLGAVTRRAVVWSLGFVVLGERLLGTALSGLAQWSPGWEARAVYARYGPDAFDGLHRAGIPEGGSAIVRLVIIAVVALAFAALRLGRLRLSGPSGD